jgi:hypothetical protein
MLFQKPVLLRRNVARNIGHALGLAGLYDDGRIARSLDAVGLLHLAHRAGAAPVRPASSSIGWRWRARWPSLRQCNGRPPSGCAAQCDRRRTAPCLNPRLCWTDVWPTRPRLRRRSTPAL